MNGEQKLRGLKGRRITKITGPSKTKQSFRDGSTVDAVLKRYATQGVNANDVGLFRQNVAQMPFGVQTAYTFDYQAQLNEVLRVQSYFQNLPSRMRDKFGHDPAQMLAFMADPKNMEECQKMGLFHKEAEAPAPAGAAPGNTAPPGAPK